MCNVIELSQMKFIKISEHYKYSLGLTLVDIQNLCAKQWVPSM